MSERQLGACKLQLAQRRQEATMYTGTTKMLAHRLSCAMRQQQKVVINLLNARHQSTDRYSPKFDNFQVEAKNQVLWVKFNRPKKYNAITVDMYLYLTETFKQINEDDSIKALVLTGNGEYYSSGNDLSNLTLAMQDEKGPRAGLKKSSELLHEFVDSLINSEKFLIAAVNGPAVGIPVTTLPLFDYTLASDKATFQTPFTALGQCAEACSSVTIPAIMGPSRASELLLLNMKWSAQKAQNYGLVSEVIEHDKFHSHLDQLLYGKQGIVETCYPQSLKVGKKLLRNPSIKQQLVDANRRECDNILELWCGDECADAMQKFFSRSKK